MQRPLSDAELLEIGASIEDYHSIFYKFFEMSSVMFDDHVPTACVCFLKHGKPELRLGEKFWVGLNLRERLFVICHECLHVLLDHGIRNGLEIPGATPELVNKAQDITINEMIVDLFGYDREDLRNWQKYCWIETCFENHVLIKRNETFIYYLKKLIEEPPKEGEDDGPTTLDEHGLQPDGSSTSPGTGETETPGEQEAREGIAEELAGELTAQELGDLLKALPEGLDPQAGTMAGRLEQVLAKKAKKLKVKFSHIIRKLKKTSMKEEDRDVETFTHEDRRFSDVMRRSGATLPGKNEVPRLLPDRLLTAVFMDISGSCMDYFDIFEKVFLAFDEEREIFDCRLFIFDTVVKEVRPGDNIRVGGGTSFNIIETKCLELEQETGRYPDCCVIITDGYGTEVKPKAPSRWIFLLTPKEWTESLIPMKSRKFFINQITF